MAYYADDFTGSTDVLEALTSGGIETVLFVAPPDEEMLRRYAHVRAIGFAGNSRTMSPNEMEAALPEIFCGLLKFRPQIAHYKVCSTFDSSPEIGSIGRAIDIGHRVFQNQIVPLVVGAPALRRYCVFGNLFAQSGLNSAPFRLDRHPTMQCHPVTPMTEADLRVHVSKQTSRPIELVDAVALENGYGAAREVLDRARQSGSVVLLDTLTDDHLQTIGHLISYVQRRERKPLFVAGSSGIEYALAKHWQTVGTAPAAQGAPPQRHATTIPSVDQTIVVSGSCSPVTERQITWALVHGFAEVALDTVRLCETRQLEVEISELSKQIVSLLDTGRSVIAHTSRGPADSRIAATNSVTAFRSECDRELGALLGRVLREAIRASSVRRVAVVGGDTSGRVARSLEIDALEMIGPLEPGAPLCIARSRERSIDGLEIAFKGGQIGYDDFFGTLLRGQATHSAIGASK